MRLRFAPTTLIQIGFVLDSGDGPLESPADDKGNPLVVSAQVDLAKLKGSPFYDELLAKLPEIQAEWDKQHPEPNRATRRANGKTKATA